jgi:hypothetical protein
MCHDNPKYGAQNNFQKHQYSNITLSDLSCQFQVFPPKGVIYSPAPSTPTCTYNVKKCQSTHLLDSLALHIPAPLMMIRPIFRYLNPSLMLCYHTHGFNLFILKTTCFPIKSIWNTQNIPVSLFLAAWIKSHLSRMKPNVMIFLNYRANNLKKNHQTLLSKFSLVANEWTGFPTRILRLFFVEYYE